MNKLKVLILLAVLSSFLGYLQWGKNQHSFVFENEFELLSKLPGNASTFTHPFVLLPFLGQLILILTLFKKKPHSFIIYIALGSIGILYLMILFVGFMGAGVLTALSAIPFLVISFIIVRFLFKNRKNKI